MTKHLFCLRYSLFVLALALSACAVSPNSTVESFPVTAVSRQTKGDAEREAVPKSQPATGAETTDGSFTADLGFRPTPDGFSFENYTDEAPVTNLTAVELRRLFGDQVCASLTKDNCTLTPPARRWMEAENASMKNGHCEGMAVLSVLFYTGTLNAATFGSQRAWDLKLEDNPALQREIAYWYTTQSTLPAMNAIVEASPRRIMEILERAYADGWQASDAYTIGIFKPDHSGGHAVTPYAVEKKSDSEVWIMVYDNNMPGEARHIVVNPQADTWEYETSPNPSQESDLYQGGADTGTLELAPIQPRMQQQQCPFCGQQQDERSDATKGGARNGQLYNQVWMTGRARLLLVDAQNRKLGYEQGKFFDDIPGARIVQFKGGRVNPTDVDAPPVYWMPAGVPFTVTIDGRNVDAVSETVDLTMIGPGYYIGVEDITIDPQQTDYVKFSGDGSWVRYKTEYVETPVLVVGLEREQADFELALTAANIESGSEVVVEVDSARGAMTFYATSTATTTFGLQMSRIDDQSVQTFEGADLTLEPQDRFTAHFAEWAGDGTGLKATLSNGETSESIDLADQK